MRSFAIALLVAVMMLIASGSAPAQTAPYEINVLLPLTGPVALLGQSMLKVFETAEKVVNAKGGVGGRPIRFVMLDDTSSPPVGVQLMQGLIAKNVPVVFGSPFVAVCQAVAPLLRNGPVDYCLAPIMHPQPRSYVFASGASSTDEAVLMARYFRAHKLLRVAIITSSDATGNDMDEAFATVFARPENRSLQVLAREHFSPADIGVGAQLARVKAANPQVLVTWSVGTPFGTLLRGIRDAGLDSIPIVGGQGNMLYSVMGQLKDVLPRELLFPGYRAMVENDVRPGPIRDAQSVYFKAFRAAAIRPDIAAVTAWDPIILVTDALRKLGPATTAEQMHAYLEDLHSYAGINSIYDFRDGSQRGAGVDALTMQRWERAKNDWVAVSGAGGAVR
jgi:branched-chain amino acid transport system substrate-binding protein